MVNRPKLLMEDVIYAKCGHDDIVCLLKDGSVWTWGYNYADSCGVKDSMVVSGPVKAAGDAVMVWIGRTESNIDCVDISEFGGEYRRQLENTIILKDDGTYWACGIGIGTEEKMLPRYWEVDYFKVICSDEFVEIEGDSDLAGIL